MDPLILPAFVEMKMALAPLAAAFLAPAIGTLAGGLFSKLFGGKSSSEKASERLLAQGAKTQNALLAQKARLARELEQLARGPSAAKGILGATDGKGFQVGAEGSNIGSILDKIDFDKLRTTGELSSLIGQLDSGTSSVNTFGSLGAQEGVRRGDSIAGFTKGLTDRLSQPGLFDSLFGGGRGGGTSLGMGNSGIFGDLG